MPKHKTLDETYDSCLAEGKILAIAEVNKEKIKFMVSNADITISAANILIKSLKKDNKEWMNVYINYYEALRIYAEALLMTKKIKVSNHQCMFSCLCMKFPELDFSWDFFEKIRTKRNSANYYGERISYEDWKSIELQVKLYISAVKREIEKQV